MKIYYDFEFLELGPAHPIRLISGAFVREDGKELYFVNEGILNEPMHLELVNHAWLMQNVIPSLPGEMINDGFILDLDDDSVMSLSEIKSAVYQFLAEADAICDTNDGLELWGWYSGYDHVVYSQIFGRMIDLPHGLPMVTFDVYQEWARLGKPLGLPDQTKGQHNALEDARHIKKMHEWLIKYDDDLLTECLGGNCGR